jgi:hypothetical protein
MQGTPQEFIWEFVWVIPVGFGLALLFVALDKALQRFRDAHPLLLTSMAIAILCLGVLSAYWIVNPPSLPSIPVLRWLQSLRLSLPEWAPHPRDYLFLMAAVVVYSFDLLIKVVSGVTSFHGGDIGLVALSIGVLTVLHLLLGAAGVDPIRTMTLIDMSLLAIALGLVSISSPRVLKRRLHGHPQLTAYLRVMWHFLLLAYPCYLFFYQL